MRQSEYLLLSDWLAAGYYHLRWSVLIAVNALDSFFRGLYNILRWVVTTVIQPQKRFQIQM